MVESFRRTPYIYYLAATVNTGTGSAERDALVQPDFSRSFAFFLVPLASCESPTTIPEGVIINFHILFGDPSPSDGVGCRVDEGIVLSM